MTSVTISLPEPTLDWAESAAREGGYADVSAYLRALIDRDRDEHPLTREELHQILIEAEESGVSERTIDDIAADAKAKAAAAQRR